MNKIFRAPGLHDNDSQARDDHPPNFHWPYYNHSLLIHKCLTIFKNNNPYFKSKDYT